MLRYCEPLIAIRATPSCHRSYEKTVLIVGQGESHSNASLYRSQQVVAFAGGWGMIGSVARLEKDVNCWSPRTRPSDAGMKLRKRWNDAAVVDAKATLNSHISPTCSLI